MIATITTFDEDDDVPQVAEQVKLDNDEVVPVTDDRVPETATRTLEVFHQVSGYTQFHDPDAPEDEDEFQEHWEKVADVHLLAEKTVENVFSVMQGERWCDHTELGEELHERVQEHIREHDTHTSMSVGDIVRDENGSLHMTEGVGFTKLVVMGGGKIRTAEAVAEAHEQEWSDYSSERDKR